MTLKTLMHMSLAIAFLLPAISIASGTDAKCKQLLSSEAQQVLQQEAQARFLKAHLKYNSMMPQVGMGIELGMALDYANSPYSLSQLAPVVQKNQLLEHVARAMNRLHSAANISHRASENQQPIAEGFTPVLRDRMNSLIVTSYLLLLRSAFRLLEKTWTYAPQEFYDIKTPFIDQTMRTVSVQGEQSNVDWTVVLKAAQFVDLHSHRLGEGAGKSERKDFSAVVDLLTSFMADISNDSTDLGSLLKNYRNALSQGDRSVRRTIQMEFLRLVVLEFRKNLPSMGDVEMLIWMEALLGPIGVDALNEAYPDLDIVYGSSFW